MEIEGALKFADLPEGAQASVRNVAAYFTMQFDNNDWGPFLEEVTPYSIDADAALVPAALGTLMTYCMHPSANWDVNGFPWTVPYLSAAFEVALKIEIIRQYIIGYVEMPDTSRIGAPDVVRRDYLNRWQSVLTDYQNQLKEAGKKLSTVLQDMSASQNTIALIDWASTPYASLGWPFFDFYEKPLPWWGR